MLGTFGQYARHEFKIEVGNYDDSLSFSGIDGPADIELLWLDFARYSMEPAGLADWLTDRIDHLRGFSDAPILIADAFQPELRKNGVAKAVTDVTAFQPGTHPVELGALATEMGDAFFDVERAEFQGTVISGQAQVRIARDLALKYVPASIAPRIKAIAIDLDNTLYRGVLGEDGPDGLTLTDGHRTLQKALVKLGEDGVLLTIVSKNEAEDVRALFDRRADFPLRPEHLAGEKVNWRSKAENIRELAAEFNIAAEAFLHLDDNPGEIVQVVAEIPGIDFLHADDEAELTVEELGHYPGLFAWTITESDRLRAGDIAAAAKRKKAIAESGNGEEFDRDSFLRSMGTRVELAMNPPELYDRLCSIPIKTNQFNLALNRLSEVDVKGYLDKPDAYAVAFSLKDNLSDSGNVGALYAHVEDDALIVDELCVSCRALGRGIEDILIRDGLLFIRDVTDHPLKTVRFKYRHGPRNGPALSWLAEFSGIAPAIADGQEGDENNAVEEIAVPFDALDERSNGQADAPVIVTRRDAGTDKEAGAVSPDPASRTAPRSGSTITDISHGDIREISGDSLKTARRQPAEFVAPESETEKRLARIWSDLLEVSRVGRADNFFDLGGDSLSFVRMVLVAEDAFAVRFPATAIDGKGTLGTLAALLDEMTMAAPGNADNLQRSGEPAGAGRKPDHPRRRTLVSRIRRRISGFLQMRRLRASAPTGKTGVSAELLRQLRFSAADWPGQSMSDDLPVFGLNLDGTQTPIFWCFNGGHEPYAMAEILGPDQPVYAFRSMSKVVPDVEYRYRHSEDLARLYAAEIRKMVPDGPYFIGGNCQGGRIAEFMARILRQDGYEVPQLCLLDYLPESPYPDRVALFFGKESEGFNPFLESGEPQGDWQSLHKQVVWDIVPGGHAQYFTEPNAKPFLLRLKARLSEAISARAVSAA